MSDIDKTSLTERDICTKFINPALEAAGWDLMHHLLLGRSSPRILPLAKSSLSATVSSIFTAWCAKFSD